MRVYLFEHLGLRVRKDGYVETDRGWFKGSTNKLGYRIVRAPLNRKFYTVHRLVAIAFVPNPSPENFRNVDHINGDPGNNRPENLRWVSQQLNLLNTRAKNSHLDQRYGRWAAQVTFQGRQRALGSYATQELATAAGHDYKELLFHFEYLLKSDAEHPARTYRTFVHGVPSSFAMAVERSRSRVRGHPSFRKQISILLAEYPSAEFVLGENFVQSN